MSGTTADFKQPLNELKRGDAAVRRFNKTAALCAAQLSAATSLLVRAKVDAILCKLNL